jgi:Skp family chaperone for outer membrane proteins
MTKTLLVLSLLMVACAHDPPRMASVDVRAFTDGQPTPGPPIALEHGYELVRPRAREAAKQQSCNLVVDHENVVYAAADIDLTPTLLGRAQGATRLGEHAAIVSLQRALETTREGQRARAQLKAEFDVKQGELDRRQEAIKAKFGKDSEAAMRSSEFVELSRRFRALKAEMEQHETETTRAILERLRSDAAALAQRRGIDVILEVSSRGSEVLYRSGVAFPPAGPDLTDELIRLHDERFP